MRLTQDLLRSVELAIFDFDGVFTDNTVIVSEDGKESVKCWRSDGLGLSRLCKLGIKIYIVSTEKNPVVGVRAKKLEVSYFQGVEDKAIAIRKIAGDANIALTKTMFVGNDINDIPAWMEVGFPVAVADAYPEIDKYVLLKTVKKGGFGAVREICDLIYNAKITD
jgi:YrbI family 3-deoxy-D-manno-octulosonate 8-phosphate phosphatase